MFIIKYKKIFISIAIVLVLASLISLFTFGLNIGMDFKGGSKLEVVYTDVRPEQSLILAEVGKLNLGSVLVQPTGDLGYIIKTRDINQDEYEQLLGALSFDGVSFEEVGFNSIGPSVGRELTRKAIIAVVLVSLCIILFIAFAFRGVSKPVSSWRYGFVAITTLLHDVIIPIGLFVILSKFFGAEVDTLFVVAVLTILGLSVSDTIVIFDRVRENLNNKENQGTKFAEIVGLSLEQSYARSIATSTTTLLVLFALFLFGPESTKYFALMLGTGMFFGAYSSIFVASPLLVLVSEWQNK